MPPTLVLVNPYAHGGRSVRRWEAALPLVRRTLGELHVTITERPHHLVDHLTGAYAEGMRRVIGVGGDGTNFTLLNALLPFNRAQGESAPFVYGTLPVGTGCDWARGQGIPRDLTRAVTWMSSARPRLFDVGHIRFDEQERYFLNIASAGLGGEVDARVGRVQQRRPWTFLRATVEAILRHQPQQVSIRLDGTDWFTGESLLVVVANGSTFGHGMRIAPHASPTDGLFDVLVLEAMPKPRLLAALGSVYTGDHLKRREIHAAQAAHVEVTSHDGPLALDLDGEHLSGRELVFSVQPGALPMMAR